MSTQQIVDGSKVSLRCLDAPLGVLGTKVFTVRLRPRERVKPLLAKLPSKNGGALPDHELAQAVLLQLEDGSAESFLRIGPDGAVDCKGGRGPWAHFWAQNDASSGSGGFTLRCVGHGEDVRGYLSWEGMNGQKNGGSSLMTRWEFVPNPHSTSTPAAPTGKEAAPLPDSTTAGYSAASATTTASSPVLGAVVAGDIQLPPTGTALRLVHVESGCTFSQVFIMERKANPTTFGLALVENRAHHLRIKPGRQIDTQGALGGWAQFVAETTSGGGFALKSLGHSQNHPNKPAFLSAVGPIPNSPNVSFSCSPGPVAWRFQPLSEQEEAELGAVAISTRNQQHVAGAKNNNNNNNNNQQDSAAAPAVKKLPDGCTVKPGDRVRLALVGQEEHCCVEPFELKLGTDPYWENGTASCPVQFGRLGGKKDHSNLRITKGAAADPNSNSTTKVIDFRGAVGGWAHFDLLPLSGTSTQSNVFALRSIGFGESEPVFLSIEVNNSIARHGKPTFTASSQPVPLVLLPLPADYNDPSAPQFDESFTLTNSQRDQFSRDGFIILKDVVPLKLRQDALRMVNNHIGKGPSAWVLEEDNGKHKLGASSHPSITNLIEQSKVWTAVQRMIGVGNLNRPGAGQLAIRFPVVDSFEEGDQTETGPNQYHIDGMQNDKLIPFTCIAKVPLSDQSEENNGNFTVFPGSHNNPDLLRWYNAHLEANRRGTPGQGVPAKPHVGQPFQVCMAPGDCAIVHPHLAHCVGRNTSPNIRYSIIFRLQHKDKASYLDSVTVENIIRDPMTGIQLLPSWESGATGGGANPTTATAGGIGSTSLGSTSVAEYPQDQV